MNTFATEIELGNGYELCVEIDVEDYEPSYEGSWGRRPEDYDPGSQGYVALGTIRAAEELEECGIEEGQEIHPAYLNGGSKALKKLEEKALDERESPSHRNDYLCDPYDDYYDR